MKSRHCASHAAGPFAALQLTLVRMVRQSDAPEYSYDLVREKSCDVPTVGLIVDTVVVGVVMDGVVVVGVVVVVDDIVVVGVVVVDVGWQFSHTRRPALLHEMSFHFPEPGIIGIISAQLSLPSALFGSSMFQLE